MPNVLRQRRQVAFHSRQRRLGKWNEARQLEEKRSGNLKQQVERCPEAEPASRSWMSGRRGLLTTPVGVLNHSPAMSVHEPASARALIVEGDEDDFHPSHPDCLRVAQASCLHAGTTGILPVFLIGQRGSFCIVRCPLSVASCPGFLRVRAPTGAPRRNRVRPAAGTRDSDGERLLGC